MKKQFQSDAELERVLREVLAPRAPAPAAFREGVERRIAERAAEKAPELESKSAERPAWLRRAAALFPPEIAGVVGFGGKWFSTALALPALILATSLGAFAASARSLRRSTREARPSPPPGAKTAAGNDHGQGMLSILQLGSFAVLFSGSLVGGEHAVDVIVGILVLSMAALTHMIRLTARSGLLQRHAVAKLCAGLLGTVFLTCFLVGTDNVVELDARFGIAGSAATVLAGSVVCAWCARGDGFGSKLGVAVMAAIAVLMLGTLPLGFTRHSPADLRAYVEGFEPVTNELQQWEEVQASFEALQAVGAERPDLSRVEVAVRTAIERGDDLHPTVLTAAARMGLVETATWRTLAQRKNEAYQLEQLLSPRAALSTLGYGEYLFHMLLAVKPPTPEQLVSLLARVEAAWPTEDVPNALDRALFCVRAFTVLGAPARIEAHRDDIQRILVRHWLGGSGAERSARVGGFTSYPEKFRISLDVPTWQGIQLMAIAGVPESIDLRLLRGYLRSQSLSPGFAGLDSPWLKAHERASLLRLEREIGMPARTWPQVLLGERLWISTLLIVALCFLAILSSPPGSAQSFRWARARAL